MIFHGIGASPGLAVAKAMIIRAVTGIDATAGPIGPEQAEAEFRRFRQAVDKASGQLETIAQRARQAENEEKAAIMDAQ